LIIDARRAMRHTYIHARCALVGQRDAYCSSASGSSHDVVSYYGKVSRLPRWCKPRADAPVIRFLAILIVAFADKVSEYDVSARD